MSFSYLPEHAESALLALELAEKEVAHLAYTHRTLFAHAHRCCNRDQTTSWRAWH